MATGERTATWTRLSDNSWGVLVRGPQADKFAGKKVPVTKRNGDSRPVDLHQLVQAWDGARKATYTVKPRRKNQAPPQKPRGKLVVSSDDLRALIANGEQTVRGITLVMKKED